MVNQPKISFVVTARNDDHGGDFNRRFNIFVRGLLFQCERHRLPAELIIVEWNPPADRPPLLQALNLPQQHDYCPVRIITVPPSIHNQYKYAKNLPLYQFIAKNAGIRRAQGSFILSTCGDLLFSDKLIDFLKNSNLKKGYLYRVDRWDIPSNIPDNLSIEDQLAFCENHLLRVNTKIGTYNLFTRQYYSSYNTIDFELTNLHFNACGDFTLMSKEDWFLIRGHPEFDAFSLHIDSLTLLIAYHHGIQQEILDSRHRLYHIEHGFSAVPEQTKKVDEQIRKIKVPGLSIKELQKIAYEMYTYRKPKQINGTDWGLSDHELSETVIYSNNVIKRQNAIPLTKNISYSIGQNPNYNEAILFLGEYPPFSDINPVDSKVLKIINDLSKKYKLIFISKYAPVNERYVENVKKAGAIYFYKKPAFVSTHTSLNLKCATFVDLDDLFKRQSFKFIFFTSAEFTLEVLNRYGSKLSNAYLIGLETDNQYKIESPATCLLNKIIDLKITFEPSIDTPSSFYYQDNSTMLFDKLDTIQSSLPRKSENTIMFENLNVDNNIFSENLVFFIYNCEESISEKTLKILLEELPANIPIIVALHSKSSKSLAESIRNRALLHLKYDNKIDLLKRIKEVVSNLNPSYIAFVSSDVIVSPNWFQHLKSHFSLHRDIGIVQPQHCDFLYESIHSFKAYAWKSYQFLKGQYDTVSYLDESCFLIKADIIQDSVDFSEICTSSANKGLKIIKAKDTLVMSLKKEKNVVQERVKYIHNVSKTLSVVIPVQKGYGLLKCLQSLAAQKNISPDEVEVILVSSAHNKRIDEIIKSLTIPFKINHIHIHNANRAILLNNGIQHSRGRYILLLSEHCIADDRLLSEHIRYHNNSERDRIALIGKISTNITTNSNSLYQFLKQKPNIASINDVFFDYKIEKLDDPTDLIFLYFYSANVSLKRETFEYTGLFDDDFETRIMDLEFGYRITNLKGTSICYTSAAKTTFDVSLSFDEIEALQYKYGKESIELLKKFNFDKHIIEDLKIMSIRHLFKRDNVIKIAAEIVNHLKDKSEELLNSYLFGRESLLNRCYYILFEHSYHKGIDSSLKYLENENWLNEYMSTTPIEVDIENENQAEAMLLKGFFMIGKRQYDEGIIHINTALSHSISPFIYYIAGLLYLDSNEFVEAERIFKEGLRIYKYTCNNRTTFPFIIPIGNMVLYYTWLAMSLIAQKKYHEAIDVLNKAIEERTTMTSDQAIFLYKCLELCYQKTGKKDHAEYCNTEYKRLEVEYKNDY